MLSAELSGFLPSSANEDLFITGGRCHFGSSGEESPVLLLNWEMREEWKNLALNKEREGFQVMDSEEYKMKAANMNLFCRE